MSRALTLLEAADQLRKSKRWLLEWLRAHPADNDGQPFYTIRFSIRPTLPGSNWLSGGICSAAQPQTAA
jgi:hypothetical protein